MSNLFKKVTSAVAALTIVLSIVSPIAGVNAAYESTLEAANKLASVGVIVDNSANPANYRLGDTITRREVMKVAMNLASCQNVELNDTYAGKFSDVPSSDWAWKYAETAVDNGFIAANATFAPARDITKGEGLKMVMNVTQIEKATGGANFWADYVTAGMEAGIVESFMDYDTTATRGWIFKVAANALEEGSCGADDTTDDNLLDDLLDGLDDTTDDTTTDDTTTDDTTVSGDATLTIALSADTPEAATVPGNVSGLPVAAYDLTAGSEDVTVTSLTIKRKGLSDADTLESIAAFTADGVSKGKDDSQNNDTEALLTLTNGLVIKAGETVTVWLVVDVASTQTGPSISHDEFALEIVEVVASADVESDGSLVANTMKVGSVDAAELVFDQGTTVSDVTLGDEGADIFKFEVQGSNDSDIVLKSVTFKSLNSDAEDDLANFQLWFDGDEVAATAEMNGKYLTFNLGDGVTIAENQTEKFVVTADIVSGADDDIEFIIDKELDVSAVDTKYGYGAAVDISAVDSVAIDSVTIEAGELTLVDIDADSDEIKEDKDDVVLGKIKVTNVAGSDLELQEFGVKVILTKGNAEVNGNSDGTLGLMELFENFELYNEDTGASYELDDPTSIDVGLTDTHVYSDDDLNVSLPQGTVTFILRADTKDNIDDFDTASLDVSLTTGSLSLSTGGFKVVETEDDTPVQDITPSSLSWNSIDGSEAGATVTLTPLADDDAVRGSDDVVALQFEVEADQSSALSIDEADVKVTYADGGSNATNLDVSSVALYKGSVSDANLLDRVSGSNLGSGVANFNGFNVDIAAGATQTFVVTLSFVDGTDPVGKEFEAQLTDLTVEDEDGDDVSYGTTIPAPTNVIISGNTGNREISVTNAGLVSTLEAKTSRTENEFDKVILAGTAQKVVSYDIKADNEAVDVETVVFTVAGGDLHAIGASASLYLGSTLVATTPNSDIDGTTITFDDLTTLIIPTTTTELKLAINSATMGDSEIGGALAGLTITNAVLSDMSGADSGIDIAGTVASSVDSAKEFDIVPVTVIASTVSSFGTDDGTAELKLTYDDGSNTDASGNAFEVEFDTLTVEVSSFGTGGTIQVFNGNGDSVSSAVAVTAVGNLTITLNAGEKVTDSNETYRIETTAEAAFRVIKSGVDYIVDGNTYTMQLSNSIPLGTYSDSN